MKLSPTLLMTASLFVFSTAANGEESQQTAIDIYNETCVVCHGSGMHGAPRPEIKSDWQQRLSYGIEELYLNTIEGVGSAMPPRGMCDSCTDAQLEAVVDYMVSGSVVGKK